MNILRLLFTFFIFNLMSCNSQSVEEINYKILEIDKAYVFYHQINEIDLEQLEERRLNTEDENFDNLKNSISKENLNNKTVQLFNEYFSQKEINELYEQSKNYDGRAKSILFPDSKTTKTITTISPELKKKRDAVYKKIFIKASEVFKKFKHQLFVLDSTNYEKYKNKTILKNTPEQKLDRTNGIYEILSSDDNAPNNEVYLNSIRINKKPSVTFDNIEEIKIEPEQSPGLFYSINIIFSKKYSKEFYNITKSNIKKPMLIVINKEIIMAPIMGNTAIENGELTITGRISYAKAKILADNMLK